MAEKSWSLGRALRGLFVKPTIDETTWEDLETALITADFGPDITERLLEELREKVDRYATTDPRDLQRMLKETLEEHFAKFDTTLKLTERPAVVLVVGVNGVGKTTTIGKFAKFLQRYERSVVVSAADTFRAAFEQDTGRAFSPEAFRAHRLRQLDQADVFVNIRAGMSESSAFELSYHVFRGACTPILFLVWKQAPIKTTLLKDLGSLCDVTYLEFDDPAELDAPVAEFFRSCERGRRSARPVLARAGA